MIELRHEFKEGAGRKSHELMNKRGFSSVLLLVLAAVVIIAGITFYWHAQKSAVPQARNIFSTEPFTTSTTISAVIPVATTTLASTLASNQWPPGTCPPNIGATNTLESFTTTSTYLYYQNSELGIHFCYNSAITVKDEKDDVHEIVWPSGDSVLFGEYGSGDFFSGCNWNNECSPMIGLLLWCDAGTDTCFDPPSSTILTTQNQNGIPYTLFWTTWIDTDTGQTLDTGMGPFVDITAKTGSYLFVPDLSVESHLSSDEIKDFMTILNTFGVLPTQN